MLTNFNKRRYIFRAVGWCGKSRRLLWFITFFSTIACFLVLNRDVSTGSRPSAIEELHGINETQDDATGNINGANRTENDTLSRVFAPPLTIGQQATLLETLNVFVNLLDIANISYYICSGTLLGSYRNHGMIPWDDDVDVCIWKHDQPRVRKALLQAAPAFELVVPPFGERWKFFATSPNATTTIREGELPWRAPFVDICPIVEYEGNYIAETLAANSLWVEKSIVFPLGWRPFAGKNLRTPRDTLSYLSNFFDVETCSTYWWSHVREERISETTEVHCSDLHHIYPFVVRSQAIISELPMVLEKLCFGSIVLNAVVVDEHASLLWP